MILRRRPPPVVEAVKGGGFALNLDSPERELLRRLLDELRTLVLSGDDQAMLQRLFPPAYHLDDDTAAETEYQRLMRADLVASRLAAIGAIGELLADPGPRTPMDAEGLQALMQALNALRLVLGTLLDVTEDDDPRTLSDEDPLAGEHQLYGYLSYVLDAAVRAATGRG
jgi:Domain of unknown function (DUF2017)